MTDAEMSEILGWSYDPCQTIVFNQDGEALYPDTEMPGRAGGAVQGKKISTLQIFIFDNLDDWAKMQEEDINSKGCHYKRSQCGVNGKRSLKLSSRSKV